MARKLRMARRTVRYDGARMRVRELRGDRAHTFVMVHGIGVSSDYFEPLAYALHDHGNVLLLDLPGFGGLPHPSAPLTISGFADIVRAGIEAESIENPVLIGHSMGAQVVVDLLARHDISSHTVLIGPVVNPAEPQVRQQVWRLLQSAAYESRRLRLLASRAYLRCGPAWILEVLPSMMRYPIGDQLQHVRADTLLITGEHDTVVPESWVEVMLAQLPQARAERIPGAAHNVVYEHWRQVAELTLSHLGLTADEPS
ncbi:alpha/beta fold hydrolase [Pseudactinotalea terrae]|uniref:alpha/beta fold hydrolase n=1 Tax=Pseudactinotalea terrae TaxID=1743262 RepID=UPI0012E2CFE0|nr:alpha/beta fold hydrolase [Pseudactinotalea terrae]